MAIKNVGKNDGTPRITFGDDHSSGADTAWKWLSAQPWPGWELDVVTVTDPPAEVTSLFMHDPLHEYTPSQERIAPPECGLGRIRYLTTAHDPRIVMCEKGDSDLIIVGARGKGLLKAMHLGSTAEWLMRCPSTPLVIARNDSPAARIVVGIDGSSHADAAVGALASLPLTQRAQVTLVCVNDGHPEAAEHAHQAAELLQGAGANTEVVVVEPDPLALTVNARNAILDVVEQSAANLVVLGTHGRTGMARLTIGSVASGVAHAARCSVLLARDPKTNDAEVELGD